MNMNCAEFQRVLPYIIDTGGNAEHEEHLRSCAVCADLVADLKYIAEQAKLLVPMQDPNPRVWDGIQKSLEREGLVKSAPARGDLLGLPHGSWVWLAPIAAMFLIVAGLYLYRAQTPAQSAAAVTSTSVSTADQDDSQVLEALAQRDPDSRSSYEQSLRNVNAFIADAKTTVEQNPDDSEARQFLMQAYEQKAMLYRMATHTTE